jgi:RecA/RadA recombinase
MTFTVLLQGVTVHKKVVYGKIPHTTLVFISTGSRSFDEVLGGGIRTGMITDVYGESGSGKSQLCFSLSANCAKAGMKVFFVDTAGTFRPERISEMTGSRGILERITVIRALNSQDQIDSIKDAINADFRLLVVDTLTSLFSAEYFGPARHLAVMSHMHDLASFAIGTDCAVLVTNMIRNAPTETGKSVQREFLAGSVSIYSHVKIKLSIVDPSRGWYTAALLQPPGNTAQFAITQGGVSDRD